MDRAAYRLDSAMDIWKERLLNRRILPLAVIIVVTLSVVFGLHRTVRLYADSTTERPSLAGAAAAFTVEPLVQGRFKLR